MFITSLLKNIRKKKCCKYKSNDDNYITEDLIQGDRFKSILNEILTPRLEELGLRWRGDYYWISETKNSIRKAVKIFCLKGGKCVLEWGITFDFLPTDANGKIVYNRTERSAKLHLFETPYGYKQSFNNRDLEPISGDGIISQWGEENLKITASRAIDELFFKIKEWFDKASTLEGALQIAKEQVSINSEQRHGKADFYNTYCIHSPAPEYVLAFLYAKLGQRDEALKIFDDLVNSKSIKVTESYELSDKIRNILIEI